MNTSDTHAWDEALNHYRLVEAKYDELCDAVDYAEAHAGEPDRVDRFFDDYKLGIGMNRKAVEYWLQRYNDGRLDKIDIERTAGEFDAYQQKVLDARARSGAQPLERARAAYLPTYYAARDALMEVPAPNTDALLVKLQIAVVSLDSNHGELALADCRRLLGREA